MGRARQPPSRLCGHQSRRKAASQQVHHLRKDAAQGQPHAFRLAWQPPQPSPVYRSGEEGQSLELTKTAIPFCNVLPGPELRISVHYLNRKFREKEKKKKIFGKFKKEENFPGQKRCKCFGIAVLFRT